MNTTSQTTANNASSESVIISFLLRVQACLAISKLILPEHNPEDYDTMASDDLSLDDVRNKLYNVWHGCNEWFLNKAERFTAKIDTVLRSTEDKLRQADEDAKRSHTDHQVRQKERLVDRTPYEIGIALLATPLIILSILVGWNAIGQYALEGVILTRFVEDEWNAFFFSLFAVLAGLIVKIRFFLINDEARREQILSATFWTILTCMILWCFSLGVLYAGAKNEGVYLIDNGIVNLTLVLSQIFGEIGIASLIWIWADKIDQQNRAVILQKTEAYSETQQDKTTSMQEWIEVADIQTSIEAAHQHALRHRDKFIEEGLTHYRAACLRRQARIAAASIPPAENSAAERNIHIIKS